jgi:hypothetical protein
MDRWGNVGNAAAATAELVVYFPVTMFSTDSATGGQWIGNYGQDGYRIAWGGSGTKEALPSYVSALTTTGSGWSATGGETSGYLESPDSDGSTDPGLLFHGSRVTYTITPSDTLDHTASVYVYDNNPVGSNSRTVRVWAEDDDGTVVSDTEVTVDSFRGGKYVNFSFAGKVTIVVGLVSGPNAVASGIFFNSTLVPDKTALRVAIDAVDALGDVSDVFTSASVAVLATALSDARDVLKDSGKGQHDIDVMVAALRDALAGLEADPGSVYAQDAADTAKALAEAQAALDKAASLAAQELANAKAALSDQVNSVVALSASGYTPESFGRLSDAIAAASKVLSDSGASAVQVRAAAAVLNNAVSQLASKPSSGDQATEPEVTNPVVKVKLAQSQLRLVQGKSVKVGAGVYFADGSSSYLGSATWKSSSPNVATVSSGGLVKAKKAGRAVITFTSKARNAAGKQFSAKVTVTVVKSKPKAKLSKVTAKVPKTLKRGTSVYITGKYVSGKAAGVKVFYSSVRPDVAVVDSAGRIVGVSKGKDTIIVKAGKKTKRYTITVK